MTSVHHRELVFVEAATPVVEIADEGGRSDDGQGAEASGVERHEDQRRDAGDATKISPALTGLPTLCSAFTAKARPLSVASNPQSLGKSSQVASAATAKAGGGQEEERVEKPQRPPEMAEVIGDPAQHQLVALPAAAPRSSPPIANDPLSPASQPLPAAGLQPEHDHLLLPTCRASYRGCRRCRNRTRGVRRRASSPRGTPCGR